MPDHEIFDRQLRRRKRDRAFGKWGDHAFVQQRIGGELLTRLDAVQRSFSNALVIGYPGPELLDGLHDNSISPVVLDPGFNFAKVAAGVQGDEDRLPIKNASFDLAFAVGTLDTVNDLPGALALVRRSLRPDGLFLGGFLGAGSLPALRQSMMAADLQSGEAHARIHPQIDIRTAGDLLARAGFAMPVTDGESLEVRYRSFGALVRDLRFSANGSLLKGKALSRTEYANARTVFEGLRQEGKTTETLELVYLAGWTPAPDQPKPAKRGSGSVSLASVLGERS